MYKRKRAGNTITRKINSTKDTAAKADKNHYISNSYLEGFIPIDTEYFTASCKKISLLPVHPVFTLSYRHLSAASGIFPPAAEHLSRTCAHLDVQEAYVLFFATFLHIYGRKRVLLQS